MRFEPSAYTSPGRLGLDACLRTGTFFFSAGIEQDMGASLPTKLLMFGFGAFVLVVVSAVSMISYCYLRIIFDTWVNSCHIFRFLSLVCCKLSSISHQGKLPIRWHYGGGY